MSSTDRAVSPITDDMVEAAASELLSDYASEYVADHLTWRDFEGEARRILSAALAGCTPIALPEPDIRYYGGSLKWNASDRRIVAKVDEQGRPFVLLDGQIWLDGEAESVGLALVAAAREARRLAEGSQEDSNE